MVALYVLRTFRRIIIKQRTVEFVPFVFVAAFVCESVVVDHGKAAYHVLVAWHVEVAYHAVVAAESSEPVDVVPHWNKK